MKSCLSRGNFFAVLISIAVLALSGAARATDYYVSPSGNDSNPGTSPGQAWQTIGKVNSETFEPGDAIYFEGGETFSGGLYFYAGDAGTPANPVTFGSYGSGRATINSGSNSGFYAYNCGGFEVRDLIFVGSGRTDPDGDNGIFFDSELSGGTRPEHVYIENVEVSGYRQVGIRVAGDSGLRGFKDVRITNAEVHDNGDVGILVGTWPPPTSHWAFQDVYIGDCKVYDNSGIPGKGPHTGNGILLHNTDGGLIEYCESYNNGWLDSSGGGGPIGLWAFDSNNVVIQFNESHHNKTGPGTVDGGGFDLDGGCVNCIMQYNYSHDNYGSGYLICQYSGAREFRNNICRYNITENDGLKNDHGAIHLWSSGSSGGIQDTQVYNNTVCVSSNTTGAGIEVPSAGIYNTYIYNNIILTAPGKSVVSVSDTSGGWSFKGNCYWSSGGPLEINWGASTHTSLAAWRSATGQEAHDGNDVGFECDPCLVNPGNGGTIDDPHLLWTLNAYRLQSSSQLINTGLDLQSLFGIDPGSRDYYGTDIPTGGQFDVGAHEYDPNAPPVARANNYTTIRDTVLNIDANLGVLANDYAHSGTLMAILVSPPASGSLTLNSDGSFEYVPDAGFIGTDSFTYKANDGEDDSNITTVSIEVLDPHPLANDDKYSITKDAVLTVDANSGVLANDYSSGGPPAAILVSQATNGLVTLNSDGSFEYVPDAGFIGTDSFTYKANWGGYESNVATVTIGVMIPVGWWKFDEGPSTIAENSGSLGSSHDGTLNNMNNSAWVEGHEGTGALEFDGIDDYVSIPALNINSNTVTMTAWIKRNGEQNDSYTGIVFSRDGSTTAGLSFGGTGPPHWQINNELAYCWNDEPAAWDWHCGLFIPDNEWAFVAVVVEPTKATLYMGQNGTLSSATNEINHNIEEFNGATLIGHDMWGFNRHFKGTIDDVRIYDCALSSAEIEELAGFDPIELLLDLSQDVNDLGLQQGIANSLLAKLDTALQKLEDTNEKNDVAAINSLQAFINAIEAQWGKKIPEADADALIAAALEIIDLLGAE